MMYVYEVWRSQGLHNQDLMLGKVYHDQAVGLKCLNTYE